MKLPFFLRRSHWLSVIREWLWRKFRPDWELPSGVTVAIESSSDWITFCDLFVNAEYDEAIMGCLENTSREAVVLDLGANVGFFLLRLVHLSRNFHREISLQYTGVEPNRACVERLQECVAGVQSPQVRASVIQGLAGLREGSASFQSSEFHISSRVMHGRRGLNIPYVDLDPVFGGLSIDLLKIDIEGSEEVFLKEYGGLLGRTRRIIIEIHGDLCDAGSCRETLLMHGFERRGFKQVTPHFTLELYVRAAGAQCG